MQSEQDALKINEDKLAAELHSWDLASDEDLINFETKLSLVAVSETPAANTIDNTQN